VRKKRAAIIPALAAVLCLFSCPTLAAGTWAELSWDDGDLGPWGTPFAAGRRGQMLAVGFEAPEWARVIIGAKFYIYNDGLDHPIDPELPSSLPFLVRVWHPSGGLLDPPGYPSIDGISTSICSAYPYYTPEDAWLEVELEVPILLEPEPGGEARVFFVGMEWQHRLNPCIGRDISDAPHYTSWFWNWSSWEFRTQDDLMVRAIVADQAGTPVELESWGCLKARYLE